MNDKTMAPKLGLSDNNIYDPNALEKKWEAFWEKEKIYSPDLKNAKKPFYNLMMFPYPSAEGMHVGNMYAFTGADVFGRLKRMMGNDVFEPIGLDGFGIHSENYAIKIGKHPKEQAKISEKNFYRQLRSIGNGFDWTRTVETYKPEYYKWTQWLFVQLFKAGLAYRKKAPVNFCPSCKTVLSDEQVITKLKITEEISVCERCETEIIRKELEQWFFKITKYADRLIDNLNKIDWVEKVKIAQRGWIGRSEGLMINFDGIDVFTTRPETTDGATFLVLSPQHPKTKEFKSKEVVDYIKDSSNKKGEKGQKEKTGVFTGEYAVNPITKKKIPIWIADYVLMGYGTGAIMAVPSQDQRDREFAEKYKLPIEKTSLSVRPEGKRVVNYHLRDWLISRQRYWGPPIPLVFCENCAQRINDKRLMIKEEFSKGEMENPGWIAVKEADLPVKLPFIKDYKPLGTASNAGGAVKSPLDNVPEFFKTTCPNCKGPAKRETDVSDTFLDSAWYFFRYVSTDIDSMIFDIKNIKKWLPVNMYIGGAEHSVLHLLYARFITMVLKDLKLIDFEEPFTKFYAHGLIIKDGAKMSKSKGNVIVPDQYIAKYGADTLRCYLMFLGPFSEGGDFRDSGIEGMYRFLKRVWTLFIKNKTFFSKANFSKVSNNRLSFMNRTIKKVTEDVNSLHYNTAIANLMEYYNSLSKQKEVSLAEIKVLVLLLAPFAPYMAEELYQRLKIEDLLLKNNGEKNHQSSIINHKSFDSIHLQAWPTYDPKFLVESEVVITVQVNGKLRDILRIKNEELKTRSVIEQRARESDKLNKYLDGKIVKKVIYVEGKVINFVV